MNFSGEQSGLQASRAGSVKELGTKRNITQADREKAKRFRDLWLKRKDALELTQKKAALRLNIAQASFSQYLNCVIALNTDMVLKIARLLEVSPGEIDPELSKKFASSSSSVVSETVPVIGAIPGPLTRKGKRTVTVHMAEATLRESNAMYALLATEALPDGTPAGSYLVVSAMADPDPGDMVMVQTLDQEWHYGRLEKLTKTAVRVMRGDQEMVIPRRDAFAVHKVVSVQFP